MKDILRDSAFGQIVNFCSKGRLLSYRDQRTDYVIPTRYLTGTPTPSISNTGTPSLSVSVKSVTITHFHDEKLSSEAKDGKELEEGTMKALPREETNPYPFLVDWEGEDDQDNPRNWSKGKRVLVGSEIVLLNLSVYIGSAIYTPAIPGLMVRFDITNTVATLGLTLFVFAYGIGPMLLSPLQEMPSWGRNPAYIISLFLFVLFQLPPLVAHNIATILVFRFFAGFVVAPALSTGGATLGDIFSPGAQPYAIGAWAMGGVCGPIIGPVIGGFAAMEKGWKWPFLELLWISGFAFIVLFFFLPETLESTILIRRAERLRKLTGNNQLKTQAELDEKAGSTPLGRALANCIMAFRISVEPAVGFANLYTGLVYAVFYLWFESFPLVFDDIYHFNLGLSGLPFLGFVVSGAVTFLFYVLYIKYRLAPRYVKDPNLAPEARLELALAASVFIPISLFIFGWSARPNSHWMGPIVGAALYLPGLFLLFQCILVYVAIGYPKQLASLFAGNALFRATGGAFFPLFGRAFFKRLGLGGGSSLLAGISILMIPALYVLMKTGARLRARSRFAL